MKKKVLCRFMTSGKVLKLVERTESDGSWTDYLIMDGRKRAKKSKVYYSAELAWFEFENRCKEYFDYVMEGGQS